MMEARSVIPVMLILIGTMMFISQSISAQVISLENYPIQGGWRYRVTFTVYNSTPSKLDRFIVEIPFRVYGALLVRDDLSIPFAIYESRLLIEDSIDSGQCRTYTLYWGNSLIKDNVFAFNWWNENWENRVKLTITNYHPESYIIGVTLPFVDYSIRIFEEEASNELPYWVEKCENKQMLVWIKRFKANSGQDNVIYVYYGNPKEGLKSDSTIFPVYENFDDKSIDNLLARGWTKYYTTNTNSASAPTYEVVNGMLHIYNPYSYGHDAWIILPVRLSDFVIRYCWKIVGQNMTYGRDYCLVRLTDDKSSYYRVDASYSYGSAIYRSSSKVADIGGNISLSKWYSTEVKVYRNKVTAYISDIGWGSFVDSSPLTGTNIALGQYESNQYFDNIIVRPYVEPEPYVSRMEFDNCIRTLSVVSVGDVETLDIEINPSSIDLTMNREKASVTIPVVFKSVNGYMGKLYVAGMEDNYFSVVPSVSSFILRDTFVMDFVINAKGNPETAYYTYKVKVTDNVRTWEIPIIISWERADFRIIFPNRISLTLGDVYENRLLIERLKGYDYSIEVSIMNVKEGLRVDRVDDNIRIVALKKGVWTFDIYARGEDGISHTLMVVVKVEEKQLIPREAMFYGGLATMLMGFILLPVIGVPRGYGRR